MNLLHRIVERGRYYLASLFAGDVERAFRQENARFWARHLPDRGQMSGDHFVLVEQQRHPLVNHCNASFAAIVSHARGLRPLFLVSRFSDASMRRVLRSYHPDAAFAYVNGLRYLPARLLAVFQAVRAWRRFESPDDVLGFEMDGIRFGDILYDNVLILGYATLRRVDAKVLLVLYAFFVQRHVILDIVRRYRIDVAVLSHTIGLPGGTCARYLLKHGIELINRAGSHEILLKKCRSPADAWFYSARPEPRYFEYMMALPEQAIVPLADAYLDDRLNQQVKHVAVEMAFSKDKRTFADHGEFCGNFGLDPGKKTVFVMLHAFNDHPHSHFARRMLYRDYFDWFERTLEVAKQADSVNWVFKEHPAAEFYPTRDVDLDAIFRPVTHAHVVYLRRDADFNARSIRYLAHAVVTCLGTAGLEYSCLGVPCILAGESPYTGFGFTIEPATAAEHEALLRHPERIGRLGAAQIKAAKIVMYFELPLIHGQPYLLSPYYEYRELRAMRAQALQRDLTTHLRHLNSAAVRRQLDEFAEFLRDPEYTQYVNMEKFPFMKGALPHRRGRGTSMERRHAKAEEKL